MDKQQISSLVDSFSRARDVIDPILQGDPVGAGMALLSGIKIANTASAEKSSAALQLLQTQTPQQGTQPAREFGPSEPKPSEPKPGELKRR
jgi:hypothetical protein